MNFSSKIESKRIELVRPFPATFELAKEIYAAIESSREHISKWLSWAKTLNSAEEEFIVLHDHYFKNWEEEKSFAYLIRNKETHEFLGIIDLIQINQKHHKAEIGFWLASHACGKGYMTEAVLALEQEAFKQGFHRIVIGNDTENIKSANVAKNAGYQLDGIMRQDRFDETRGEFRDSNVFSKINPSFP